jgi:hypothetical protein
MLESLHPIHKWSLIDVTGWHNGIYRQVTDQAKQAREAWYAGIVTSRVEGL